MPFCDQDNILLKIQDGCHKKMTLSKITYNLSWLEMIHYPKSRLAETFPLKIIIFLSKIKFSQKSKMAAGWWVYLAVVGKGLITQTIQMKTITKPVETNLTK